MLLPKAIELLQACKNEAAVSSLEEALKAKDVGRLEHAIAQAKALSTPVSDKSLLDDAVKRHQKNHIVFQ